MRVMDLQRRPCFLVPKCRELLRKHCERVNAGPYSSSLHSLSFLYDQISNPSIQYKHPGLAHIASLHSDLTNIRISMSAPPLLPSRRSVTLQSSLRSSMISWLCLSPTFMVGFLEQFSCSPNYMEHWRTSRPQDVDLSKIEAGVDVRNTTMLRNIPNRVDLKPFLDATSEGHYDFSYLRVGFPRGSYFSTYILSVLL